jgi:hypothetical protein
MCALVYRYGNEFDGGGFDQTPNPGEALERFVGDPLYWREPTSIGPNVGNDFD